MREEKKNYDFATILYMHIHYIETDPNDRSWSYDCSTRLSMSHTHIHTSINSFSTRFPVRFFEECEQACCLCCLDQQHRQLQAILSSFSASLSFCSRLYLYMFFVITCILFDVNCLFDALKRANHTHTHKFILQLLIRAGIFFCVFGWPCDYTENNKYIFSYFISDIKTTIGIEQIKNQTVWNWSSSYKWMWMAHVAHFFDVYARS